MENSWLEDAISREEVHFIAYDEFTYLQKIVESASSSIYKAEWENYGMTIALKTIKAAYIRKDIFEEFVRELKHLQSVRFHENISHFYGISKDPDGYYKLVLQYANNGNLRDYLKDNFQKLQWIDKFRIAKEIAQGLVCLHNNGMMHRDLHSRNVLIHGGRALIADFGLAKLETSTSVSPSYFHGITAFMEPKCFVDQTYKRNPKSDVYSYGVILWEISSGRKPFQRFKSREAIAIQIFSGNREKPVEGTPSEYIELYTQCWDGVPDKRPEMKTALSIINQLEQKYSNKDISRSLKGLLDIAIIDNHINYHDYNEFSDITKIDEEEFGSVYKSVWNKNDGLTIVLKCLKVKEDYLNEWIVQNFASKLHILQNNCVQENIIKFYGVTKDPDGYYNTIFQYAEEGDLHRYLEFNFSNLQWNDKLHMAQQIAEGLKFLHKNNIAHCDLNSNSIVVHKGKVIVAGFGISEQMNEVSLSRSIARKLQAYIEPQCFKEPSYKRDLRSDVYSFGVILWEISSGRPPFNGLEGFSITIHIFKGNRETPIVDTPPKYVEIYTQCWDEDPVKRPTMPAVLDILNGLII